MPDLARAAALTAARAAAASESIARALRERLRALPVAIEGMACTAGEAAVPSYPGGSRPTATVALTGLGQRGCGEHVAWSDAEHRALARQLQGLVACGEHGVGALSDALRRVVDAPHARAAIEAAAIDLALRQAHTTLFALAGREPQPVRYVVSFARVADPAAAARTEIGASETLELKIDVDPAWSDATYAELASVPRIAVLDFKRSGTAADHERAHAALPAAWIEDPLEAAQASWSPSLRARLALDAAVTDAAAIVTFDPPPAAINVKPARMGGVLEAIAAVEACAARGIACYFGGMFEVDVGRRQLCELAALLCPDGPNDIAPLARAGAPAPRPARLVVSGRGFGFGADV